MNICLDSHYHFDFLQGQALKEAFLRELAVRKIQICAQTVTPSGYRELMEYNRQSSFSPLYSLGFHPWWIQSSEQVEQELALFKQLLGSTRFIGEIGLDFSPRRVVQASEELQSTVFRQMIAAICQQANQQQLHGQPFVLSIHAVKATTTVLDILEEFQVCHHPIIPIIHRFAGTSDELTRLIRLGGYVSVHPQHFTTKRGRAFMRQVPAARLVLESDLPSDQVAEGHLTGCQLADELEQVLQTSLAKLNDLRQDTIDSIMSNTQATLYGIGKKL